MQMTRPITLPQTPTFYTRQYAFPVTIVSGACNNYTDTSSQPPRTYSLSLNPNMKMMLRSYGAVHTASLDSLARASVQFFRTSEGDSEALDHMDLQFMQTYDFGRVLTSGPGVGSNSTLGPATAQASMRHGEAVKRTSEMFGYGLALSYVASVLGVSTDRFTFILGSGARPDFETKMTIGELVEANPTLETIGPDGHLIYVEVKARIGWNSMREAKDTAGLLLNCAKKAGTCNDGILLSIIVGLPKRSDSPHRTPCILVADPNNPQPLSRNKQAVFLLHRYLFLAQRYGLHLMKRHIYRWLRDLRVELADWQYVELDRLETQFSEGRRRHPFLPCRIIGDRNCQGRYFCSLLERLGKPGHRRLTVEEAKAAIEGGSMGSKYFVGVDIELMEILDRKDIETLCTFGVRGRGRVDLSATSAFREMQLELEDQERAEVKATVQRALDHYYRHETW